MSAIAIVGLGCVLPDAFDVPSFWALALEGRSAIRPLAGETWDWARYLDASGNDPDRTWSAIGAQVLGWHIDWKRFRIPPADLQAVNPLQFMVLDAGTQALSAVRKLPKERTGLFLGSTGLGWQRDTGLRLHLSEALEAIERSASFRALPAGVRHGALAVMQKELDLRLKPVSEDNVVGAAASVAAGRIAMQFDLHGLHYGVDAGFASSLASLDVGVRALRDGTLDMAVVGGVSELLTPLELVAFSRLGGLAKRAIAPFSADAEGTLLGEGAVIFALKRLEDALADGETIHAVVRGVGGSSDGKGKSAVAPRTDGQAQAMRRAFEDGDVDAREVRFVECHATGTQIGDASEVKALAQVLPGGEDKVLIGSVKAQVGHLRAGAGAVGLLRAVLAVRERVVPPQIGLGVVNPTLELERTPFAIATTAHALPASGSITAGVSAFGFGGTNFHAVIESAPAPGQKLLPSARAPRENVARGAKAIDVHEPIAIVGMGGSFPTGADVPSFWQSLLDEKDATREVPAERWSIERHHDADPTRLDKSYSKLGCFLPSLPTPSAGMGIPPAAFATLDPSQTLVLRATEEALAASGIDIAAERERTSVYLAFLPYQGAKFSADLRVNWREYEHELERALDAAGVVEPQRSRVRSEAEAAFKQSLPPITEDSLTGYLGSLCAARVTRTYDLHGPHFVVDSACASTHAALHAAVTALRHRTADLVLSGGVWCDMRPEFFVAACRFNALSATGEKPFDKNADGFIPGEGVGVFALRRLSDAEARGEHIIAVIRSVAGSSDGRGRSVLAPKPEGEALAMTRALTAADIDPASVAYVECHGTGTALGDATEVDAMTRVYGNGRSTPLLIGSVKSNIGHLNAAAGVPSVIKAALALQTGTLPASLKCVEPNPTVDWQKGPVEVVTRRREMPHTEGSPRRIGVSGFGVGGSNMHLILEEHVAREPRRDRTSDAADDMLPIVAAGGGDRKSAMAALHALLARARAEGIAAVLGRGDAEIGGPHRVVVVAASVDALEKKVQLLASSAPPAALRSAGVFVGTVDRSAHVAFTFPGQGTQYAGMASELQRRFPVVRETFAEVDAAYARLTGRMLTPAFLANPGGELSLRDEDAHCAVFAVAVAIARLLHTYGAQPDMVLGQSAGELAALVTAGALSLEDGLRLVHGRTAAVLALRTEDPGKMVSLRCGVGQARTLMAQVDGFLVIAADNCKTACLVSGSTAACAALGQLATDAGVEVSVLPVSHAYHSQMIAGAQPAYRRALNTAAFGPPRVPHYSTVTGDRVSCATAEDWRALLHRQFVEAVRLQEAVAAAFRDGARVFVECGPKWPLSTFTDEILGEAPHVAVATLHPKTGETEQLTRSIAALVAFGRAHTSVGRAQTQAEHRLAEEERMSAASNAEPREPDPLRQLLVSVRDAIDVYLRSAAPTSAVDARAAQQLVPPLASVASLVTAAQSDAPPLPPTGSAAVEAAFPIRAVAPAETPARFAPHAPVAQASVDASQVMPVLVAAAAARTGYPPEMLEPQLDLEADLGIDTVKQVAIIVEVKQHFGLPRDPSFKLRDHSTLSKVAAHIVAKLAAPAGTSTPSALAPPAPVAAPRAPVPASVAASVAKPAGPASSPSTMPAAAAAVGAATFAEVQSVLVELAVKRTGYPPDMLEIDLDLEADLGIDTVKQVAIIAETKERFGLPRDASFKLRDHNTLRKVVDHIVTRVAARAASPAPAVALAQSVTAASSTVHVALPVASAAPTPTPSTTPSASTVPSPPSADIDVSRAPRGSALPLAQPQVAPAPSYRPVSQSSGDRGVDEIGLTGLLVEGARRAGRIGRLAALERTRIERVGMGGPLVVEAADAGAHLSLRVREGDVELAVASVLLESGPPEAALPAAARELAAIAARTDVGNGGLTRELVGQVAPWPEHVELVEGRMPAFDEVVARVRLRADAQRATDAPGVAGIVGAAAALLSVAGATLTGNGHVLAGLETGRFLRVPGPGEQLALCVRLFAPRGTRLRGQVAVVDAQGHVVIELDGLSVTASAVTLSRDLWASLRALSTQGR